MLNMNPTRNRTVITLRPGIASRGLSLVETLVGITVGLFILAGATTLLVNSLNGNRRLLLATRVNQDLRAAADLVARDLRRAGYWRKAEQGVWYKGGPAAVTANPYTSAASAVSATEAGYAYAKDDNATLSNATELFGFKLEDGRLKARVGGAWQDLTDPGATLVTGFSVTLAPQASLNLGSYCNPVGCSATLGCPTQTVRSFQITLTGQATQDAQIQRTIREEVRLRNDHVAGACAS